MTTNAEDFGGKCCVKNCDLVELAMGFCNKHWRRLKKYGSPVRLARPSASFIGLSPIVRFDLQVKKIDGGCWEWKAGKDQDGYGLFKGVVDGVIYLRAHRFSIAHFKHIHPKQGENVCHSCDNPQCANPDHLFIGTVAENQQDKWRKNRGYVQRGEKHWISKLKPEDVLAIRASTDQQRDIAEKYGITQTTVSDIRRRKSWRHI